MEHNESLFGYKCEMCQKEYDWLPHGMGQIKLNMIKLTNSDVMHKGKQIKAQTDHEEFWLKKEVKTQDPSNCFSSSSKSAQHV